MKITPVVLLILDGFGYREDIADNAIAQAKKPNWDKLWQHYPHTLINASESFVGLPAGQMGNSEVGHLNIGAGRIVFQEFERINNSIETGDFNQNSVLLEAVNKAKNADKALHIFGLISDGGVHSHQDHIYAMINLAAKQGLSKIYVHAFLDGRDTPPVSAKPYLQALEAQIQKIGAGKIASICGRYYAMDRDKRWERVKMTYDAMVNGIAAVDDNVEGLEVKIQIEELPQVIQDFYDKGITDEFLKPIVIVEDEKPVAVIEEGDVVMCFNFRTDRGREITEVLTQKDFPDFGMKALNLYYITMTMYDETYKNVKVIYEKDNLNNTLGEVLERAKKKQIRIAETEKYPHVTFFFSGGHEQPFHGESRLMCPSPKDVATYDLKPQMAAFDIDEAIIPELQKGEVDFVCLNFANPDMVGHTGVFSAVVSAVEFVDKCLEQVVETGLANGYTFIVIADHGNADYMINDDKTPNTQHSLNLVPCIIVDKTDRFEVKDGKLGDIAPTILTLMGIEIPKEMTGNVLI